MVTKPCQRCGCAITYEPLLLHGRECFQPELCEPCLATHEAARIRQQATAAAEVMAAAWHDICPPLYRDTDPHRIDAILWQAAQNWEIGPRGLGFVGSTGTGKTRSAFAALGRCHFQGHKVAAVTASKFAIICADQFSECSDTRNQARRHIRQFHRVHCLLLDDLGKSKHTQRVEAELFGLLEHRTGHKLPTIWTSNHNRIDLVHTLSPNMAEPILRRLADFSDIIIAP